MSPPPADPGPPIGHPTAPIAFGGGAASVTGRFADAAVEIPDAVVGRLRDACAVVTADPGELAEASRDWWPLAMVWALDGEVAGLASVVCRPGDAAEVAAIARICNDASVPLTAAGGRSGVLGNSVPLFGGVLLDLCGLNGIVEVDTTSMVLDVRAGTFGDALEATLRAEHGVTVGHWPQSMTLATVGGWLACRGAGQYSTRYGKIEDIVTGLDVVLADGRAITTGGYPRQAVGPDLTQLFVGSEGTLGIITGARLRLHPAPTAEVRSAWGFTSFEAGLESMRRTLQRGATPAVLRLYDSIESERNYQTPSGTCVLLALDEGDDAIIAAMMSVIEHEAGAHGGTRLDDELVSQWLERRNDVAALEQLITGGLVVDTMEVSSRWTDLPAVHLAATAAIASVPGTLVCSAHQSHSYSDGGCLYFTFAGKVEPDGRTDYHRAAWDAGVRAVLAAGGSLSHHHGVGLQRGRYVADALGGAFDVLRSLKGTLDPNGILNPGKLGLPSPFGSLPF